MYTITREQIEIYEREYGNDYETITVKDLLEMAVDLLQDKVATTKISQEYQYFLTVEDNECEDEDILIIKGTLEMLSKYLELDEEEKEL